jgi:uncharacterized low-complexity protein
MEKIISISLAALFAAAFSFSVQAAENPFGVSDLEQSSQVAMSGKPDGKCGDDKKEGKCGGDKKKEGKCGGDKKESKCGGS